LVADIDNRHMQDCFRLHPDVYGDELADDENDNAAGDAATEGASAKEAPEDSANAVTSPQASSLARKPAGSMAEASHVESSEEKEAISASTTKP
jgi:mitochondrial intermembrane space import and assembly protein 40